MRTTQATTGVLLVFCAVFALTVGVATATAGGGNKTGQTCYKGHYVDYADPSTGKAFTTEAACTASLAHTGVLYPVSTGICFDRSWALIEDLNNGADGSATSGAPCATFVMGGGSLAGVQLTTSGTPISFSYTVNAFAVNFLAQNNNSDVCTADGCNASGGTGISSIFSPFKYSTSGGLDCSLRGGTVYRDAVVSWNFTTLGGHGMAITVSCVNGTHP